MKKDSKIYIAGHNGLVGSAILRNLEKSGYKNIILRSSSQLDLRRQLEVENFFKNEKPEYIFLAAALVGGIWANNTMPADFIYSNICIQTNIIHSAYLYKVRKLLFLGSSCIYPKFAPQPMREEFLLDGKLEPTNEPYAVAKIAGIKMCQSYNRQFGTNFVSVMPTNLFGSNDNFDLNNSHVLPALIRKFHEAKTREEKEVKVWGSGQVRREFMYVDDMADACVFLMNNYDNSEIINIGTGEDVTIAELAAMIKEIAGFRGKIIFDASKPEGTPRKLLDVSRLNALGWKPKTSLRDGIKEAYQWYRQNYE